MSKKQEISKKATKKAKKVVKASIGETPLLRGFTKAQNRILSSLGGEDDKNFSDEFWVFRDGYIMYNGGDFDPSNFSKKFRDKVHEYLAENLYDVEGNVIGKVGFN